MADGKKRVPLNAAKHGGIAQLGERLLCKQEVNGSIPFISTTRLSLDAMARPLETAGGNRSGRDSLDKLPKGTASWEGSSKARSRRSERPSSGAGARV